SITTRFTRTNPALKNRVILIRLKYSCYPRLVLTLLTNMRKNKLTITLAFRSFSTKKLHLYKITREIHFHKKFLKLLDFQRFFCFFLLTGKVTIISRSFIHANALVPY